MFWELRDKELSRFDIVNVIMVLATFYLMCFGCFLKSGLLAIPLVIPFVHKYNIKYLVSKEIMLKIINTDAFNCFIIGIVLLIISIYVTICGMTIIKRYRLEKIKIKFNRFNHEYI